MRKEHQPQLRKIETVSTVLLWLLYPGFLMIASKIVVVSGITFSSPTATGQPFFESIWHAGYYFNPIQNGLLTLQDKLAVVFLFSVTALIILAGMYFAIRLVHCLKNAELFSIRSAKYARGVAYLYLAYFVVQTIPLLARVFWFSDRWKTSLVAVVSELFMEFFLENLLLLGLLSLFVWIYSTSTAIHLENEMTI